MKDSLFLKSFFSEVKVTEIYCIVDDFCKEFAILQEKYMIKDTSHKHRNKPNHMSDTEIIVLLILFHSGGFRCFKHYYQEIEDIKEGQKYMKVYKQMKMYNDPALNPVLYGNSSAK